MLAYFFLKFEEIRPDYYPIAKEKKGDEEVNNN